MVEKKTSKPSWQKSLQETWKRLQNNGKKRVAVIGIGQELYGDDAIGVLIAYLIAKQMKGQPDRLVINGGPAPENQTGPLRRFQPDLVIMIDATRMGAEPGEVRWIEAEELDGFSGSTHTLPVNILARYLAAEIGCQVVFIGVQPGRMEMGDEPSENVVRAIDEVVDGIAQVFG